MGILIFKIIRGIVIWISIFLLIAWIIIPAYWPIKTAFSRPEDAWNWIPSTLTLQNLVSLVAPTAEEYFRGHGIRAALPIPISQAIRNSFIVSLISSLISVALGFLAGYSLARFQVDLRARLRGL